MKHVRGTVQFNRHQNNYRCQSNTAIYCCVWLKLRTIVLSFISINTTEFSLQKKKWTVLMLQNYRALNTYEQGGMHVPDQKFSYNSLFWNKGVALCTMSKQLHTWLTFYCTVLYDISPTCFDANASFSGSSFIIHTVKDKRHKVENNSAAYLLWQIYG